MEQEEAIQLGGHRPTHPKGKGVTDDSGATKQKRKPVRRDPEKRRMQNIQAQKKYREKLRKRLGDLEVLAAKAAHMQGVQQTPPASEDSSPPAEADQPLAPSYEDCHDDQPFQTKQATLSPKRKNRVSAWPYDLSLVPNETDSEPDLFALWDTTTVVDPSHLMIGAGGQHRKYESQHLFTSYIDCGCPVRHIEVSGRSAHREKCLRILDVSQSLTVPDPHANHIHLQKECLIAAMWTNGLQIGISDVGFCEEDSQSPFYRDDRNSSYAVGFPGYKQNPADDSVVRTIQSIFKTLKPDLRPTREQITVPHHACLDIIPFPTLRRNLLRSETLIDEDELFNDMLHGLVCWGGTGIGKKDRNNATGHSSTGAPWDSRSWEAKPWFLRKYWDLLGGEEGELVRQSQWWRCIRGEDEDLWSIDLVT